MSGLDTLNLVGSMWRNPKSGKRCTIVLIDDYFLKLKYESGAARWALAQEFFHTHDCEREAASVSADKYPPYDGCTP